MYIFIFFVLDHLHLPRNCAMHVHCSIHNITFDLNPENRFLDFSLLIHNIFFWIQVAALQKIAANLSSFISFLCKSKIRSFFPILFLFITTFHSWFLFSKCYLYVGGRYLKYIISVICKFRTYSSTTSIEFICLKWIK